MPILDNLKVDISLNDVCRRLHMGPDSDVSEIQPLIEVAMALIEPKAIFEVRYIEDKLEDAVMVNGRHLTSRVLRKNLDQAERIFPFVITLGPKL
ncbi:MAG: hypothetical protein QNL14_09885, partial [Deltaproteobacteria bacterium]|nr:hypothetical protein [Deltaproteobacteria bacterium]